MKFFVFPGNFDVCVKIPRELNISAIQNIMVSYSIIMTYDTNDKILERFSRQNIKTALKLNGK